MPVLGLLPSLDPVWIKESMFSFVFYLSALVCGSSVVVNGVKGQEYLVGLGIGDITGPIVETNMMGYALLSQVDTGIHMRQFSRAFVIAEAENPDERIVFINSDIAMGDSGVRRSIISSLDSEFGGLYNDQNVAFVGTHQHSGVGGYLENLLPQITSLGYVPQTARAIVDGTLVAIRRAHNSLAPGRIRVGNTTIENANINRSPSAYLANPEAERRRYDADQDRTMTVLRFDDGNGSRARGLLSFFAVHGTSIYENNTLVSSDNKGMAAYLYESFVEPGVMPGNTSFIAGFTQSNVGDTSPNTEGAYCESPGQPYDGQLCEFNHSTCGGTAQQCHGRGPGFRVSDFESNRIIGERQYQGARTVMEGSSLREVSGPVRGVHVNLNMAFHEFNLPNGTRVRTCPPAMGFAFAGGTTDGPGAFDFIQGDNTSDPQNPFWEIVKGVITPLPNEEQRRCQEPKPVLLNTGYTHTPYEWQPSVVDVQMLRVGGFVILVMPGELTTMAGRRMREAIRTQLVAQNILSNDEAYVVIAGPGNTYGHYVTTREEYGVQRYEGGSTIFGQWTLDAYIERYGSLVPYLADTPPSASPSGDAPQPEQTSRAISLQTGVVFDSAGIGRSYGQVLQGPQAGRTYRSGESVSVRFVGANPRNNLRLGSTFLSVDVRDSNGNWRQVRTDAHPSTTLRWTRESTILGTSSVNITWTIEDGTPAGTYRIMYFGDAKAIGGAIRGITGVSGTFQVGQ